MKIGEEVEALLDIDLSSYIVVKDTTGFVTDVRDAGKTVEVNFNSVRRINGSVFFGDVTVEIPVGYVRLRTNKPRGL